MAPSIMIGCPCYGGQISAPTVKSLLSLSRVLTALHIEHSEFLVGNHSVITAARDVIANAFLQSSATHLLCVDADVGFDASDVVTMLNSGKEFIGLSYARKGIDWERMWQAATCGVPACDLRQHASIPVTKYDGDIVQGQPVEVPYIGLGAALISRTVFERLVNAHREAWLYQDGPNHYGWSFFHAGIDPATRKYCGEDVQFCREWQRIGGAVFMLPAHTVHVGRFDYKI